MKTIKVKLLNPEAILPEYAHGADEDAGMDLHSIEDVLIGPAHETDSPVVFVHTGLAIEIPSGYELQIRPRSGLTTKGVTVANAPGTVDPGFRGEIKVLLVNHGKGWVKIVKGQRIAQAILAKYEPCEWKVTEELADSARGENGFGSTGSVGKATRKKVK